MSNIRRALDASRRGLARARDRRLARKTPRGTTTAWIGWLIRKMLEVAVTVAGLLAFLELYFSEPAIDHGELDAAEPFSMPFTIANPHYFPLLVVERRCIVTMTYPNRLEANQQWAFQRDLLRYVSVPHLQHIAYNCPISPTPEVEDLAVRIIVRYRVWGLLPAQTAHEDFRLIRDSQRVLHWTAGLDPDRPAQDFKEYPSPTETDAIASFDCDIVDLRSGCSLTCGFTAPIAGTAFPEITKQGDTVHYHITVRPKVDPGTLGH